MGVLKCIGVAIEEGVSNRKSFDEHVEGVNTNWLTIFLGFTKTVYWTTKNNSGIFERISAKYACR